MKRADPGKGSARFEISTGGGRGMGSLGGKCMKTWERKFVNGPLREAPTMKRRPGDAVDASLGGCGGGEVVGAEREVGGGELRKDIGESIGAGVNAGKRGRSGNAGMRVCAGAAEVRLVSGTGAWGGAEATPGSSPSKTFDVQIRRRAVAIPAEFGTGFVPAWESTGCRLSHRAAVDCADGIARSG